MIALIAFCILFFLCAVVASGTAKLIYITIQHDQIFSGWQKVLYKIEPEKGDRLYFLRDFWYKRLGGCIVCMRQFIAELSFIVLCILYNFYGTFPTEHIDNLPLRWLLNCVLFIGFCGTTLQIGQWLEYEKREADNNEPIVETRYRNPN